jgi:hypothetical protein
LESNCEEHLDIEYNKLFFSVINTFALSKFSITLAHSSEIKEILGENLPNLNKKLMLLLLNNHPQDNHYYEALLRLFRTFSLNNIFICGSYEEFITDVDKFLINDVCIQYILGILRII